MKRLMLLFMLLVCGFSSAQELCDSVRICFRQGHSELTGSSSDSDTRQALRRAIALLQLGQTDSLLRIDRVCITGSASPEGSVALNRRLSVTRAQALCNQLLNCKALTSFDYEMNFVGVNWPVLLELAQADPQLPYRDETLALLQAIVDGTSVCKESDEQTRSLQRLCSGEPYRYLYHHLFPALRYAELLVCYTRFQPELTNEEPTVEDEELRIGAEVVFSKASVASPTPEIAPIESELVSDFCRPRYMSLSTNLLYDLAAVPNLGLEFYLGRRWSMELDGMYAWWNSSRKNRFWRIYGAELTGHFWLGKAAEAKPLTGHHLGLYAQALTYDFEWGGCGYMGGKPGGNLFDRATVGVGLEYGYALPLARRLNLDFALGLGYLTGKYYEYLPIDDCYVWQCTKNRRYWGPTRVAVSLVWLMGCDNYNRKKGGRR